MPYTYSERFVGEERREVYADLISSLPPSHHSTDRNWMFDAITSAEKPIVEAPVRIPRASITALVRNWLATRLMPKGTNPSLT